MLIFDFYTEQICVFKLGHKPTVRYGTLIILVSAMIVSHLLKKSVTFLSATLVTNNSGKIDIEDSVLSGEVICAMMMLIFATRLLTKPIQQRSGTVVGYGPDGSSLFSVLQSSLRDIFAQADSRKIFYFLTINLVSRIFREDVKF